MNAIAKSACVLITTGLLGAGGAAALGADATITVSTPMNPAGGVCFVTVSGGGTVPVGIPPGTTATVKRNLIVAALTGAGYAVAPPAPGGSSLTITGLAPGTVVIFSPGTTGEPNDIASAPHTGAGAGPGVPTGLMGFTGHFAPIVQQPPNTPAQFTLGIVTDVGVMTETVSSSELNFQTDGPIICQALFQRLAPRAPQYGAQINYAGDRLEVYFDPAYTVTQGGVIFGTTSPSQGCSGSVVLPAEPVVPPCPADVGVQGGAPGQDHVYDNNDFVAFISLFFSHDARADLGIQGGLPGHDANYDNNDFVVFIDEFFHGCPPH